MGRLFTIAEGLETMGALKTGGQGSVYKTRRTGEIITAVKLLPTPIHNESTDDKAFADFQNEVAKLKKVAEQPNPNVVKILSSGITETGNLPFIEMEFIEGPDLEELLKPPRAPVFTIRETIKVAEHISNALAHCHRMGVRHGDVKSNNVKCNIHTGNYVLLDFGLAVMSDEQRRTSLRHAGAVEFMAPEQSEGSFLFQTDIYSFGIILYELLAGTVPFPQKDSSEMARNRVMIAHLETPPPDVLAKRREALPSQWTAEKKEAEQAVPRWLLNTITKCLEKAPERRFADGAALHDYITANNAVNFINEAPSGNGWPQLQNENAALRTENASLQKRIELLERSAAASAQEMGALKNTLGKREAELHLLQQNGKSYAAAPAPSRKKRASVQLIAFLVMAGIGILAAYAIFGKRNSTQPVADPVTTQQPQAVPQEVVQNHNIGQFKVQAEKAYFHNEPDPATRRNAYLTSSDGATINGWEARNNFVYTEYTNSRGQLSKGWLRRDALQTLDEWQQALATDTASMVAQLAQARILASKNNMEAAANVYRDLIKAAVPEAMYELANLSLHDKYEAMPCEEATALLQQASNKGYTPAETTLGFLYLFAQNEEVLRLANYDRCPFEKNVPRGLRLLTQAMLSGDSTAGKWLEQHKQEEQP